MAKESKYSSENRRKIFYETFNDEQTVRKNGGLPTAVTFAEGAGTFNGTSSDIIYSTIFNGTYSVRILLTSLTPVNLRYLADFRGSGGTSYLRMLTGFDLQSVGGGTVYVDGIATTTITSETKEIVVSGMSLDGPVTIGSYFDGSGGSATAGFDLFEIYNYTLTAEEAANLYENRRFKGLVPSGGVSTILDVSAQSGSIIDRWGNTLTNTSTSIVKSTPGYVMEFDGSASKVDTGVPDTFVGDKTLTVWINLRSYGEGTEGRIFDNGKLMWYVNDTSDRLNLTSEGVTIVTSTTDSLSLNKWLHVCVTREADGTANFYVNGVLASAPDLDSGLPSSGTDTYIGNNDGGTRAFDGFMGPVRVYDSILTIAELNQLFSAERNKYQV